MLTYTVLVSMDIRSSNKENERPSILITCNQSHYISKATVSVQIKDSTVSSESEVIQITCNNDKVDQQISCGEHYEIYTFWNFSSENVTIICYLNNKTLQAPCQFDEAGKNFIIQYSLFSFFIALLTVFIFILSFFLCRQKLK